jgi:hypothetical protein
MEVEAELMWLSLGYIHRGEELGGQQYGVASCQLAPDRRTCSMPPGLSALSYTNGYTESQPCRFCTDIFRPLSYARLACWSLADVGTHLYLYRARPAKAIAMEVAGLVLGGFSLVIGATEYYGTMEKMSRTWWKLRREHRKDLGRLRDCELMYRANMRTLLAPLKLDGTIDAVQLELLLTDLESKGWQEHDVNEVLSKSLGERKDRYFDNLREMQEVVTKLAKVSMAQDTRFQASLARDNKVGCACSNHSVLAILITFFKETSRSSCRCCTQHDAPRERSLEVRVGKSDVYADDDVQERILVERHRALQQHSQGLPLSARRNTRR